MYNGLLSLLSFSLSLLPFLSAFPAPENHVDDLAKRGFASYTVTNFTTGCVSVDCMYKFDITNQPDTSAGEPAFTTTCVGSITTSGLRPCANPNISSSMESSTLSVSHQWVALGQKVWINEHLDLKTCGSDCGSTELGMTLDNTHALRVECSF